jgi:hypothetical protein
MNELKRIGNKTEQLFLKKLKERGVETENFGIENISNSIIFKFLFENYTNLGVYLRFKPDFLCLNREVFLAEVKTGTTIRKLCFDHCLDYEKRGYPILFFFYFESIFYFCKPSEVPFYKYAETEAGIMYHKKAKVSIPVNGIWCYPEEMNQEDLNKYKSIMNASGCSFAFLDKRKLIKLKKL